MECVRSQIQNRDYFVAKGYSPNFHNIQFTVKLYYVGNYQEIKVPKFVDGNESPEHKMIHLFTSLTLCFQRIIENNYYIILQ